MFEGMLALTGICLIWGIRRRFNERLSTVAGNLPARLTDGAVRLLSVAWLLAQPEDYVLQRRQDLPPEAFVSCADAARLLDDERVAVLSYKWLSAPHSDPAGFHMRAVRHFLYGTRYHALFWDFASCHQKDPTLWRDFMHKADEELSSEEKAFKEAYNNSRTDEEREAFSQALDVMGNFYAHPLTLVLRHKAFPPGHPTHDQRGRPIRGYDESGWPLFETACASLATEGGGMLLDLERGRVRLLASDRQSPNKMIALFRDDRIVHFVGRADR